MKTTAKQILNSAQQHLFGNKKQTQLNGYTIKYYQKRDGKLEYQIFDGLGKGSQLTSSENWREITRFVSENTHPIYLKIKSKKDGSIGGAWFFADTKKMIFTDHPYIKDGFEIL